jgi:hypothetical protein
MVELRHFQELRACVVKIQEQEQFKEQVRIRVFLKDSVNSQGNASLLDTGQHRQRTATFHIHKMLSGTS